MRVKERERERAINMCIDLYFFVYRKGFPLLFGGLDINYLI